MYACMYVCIPGKHTYLQNTGMYVCLGSKLAVCRFLPPKHTYLQITEIYVYLASWGTYIR